MSDPEKKEKKDKKKKFGLNKINNEKVTETKSDEKIKSDVLKIDFEPFFIDGIDSSIITNYGFGRPTANLKGVIEFFYSERLEENKRPAVLNGTVFVMSENKTKIKIFDYFTNIKKRLEVALNIPKIKVGYRNYIAELDGVYDPAIIKTLPRAIKFKRLELLYDQLIKIGLTLIHHYYWSDICDNETTINLNLYESIKKASPTIIELKHKFEDQVNDEFTYDKREIDLIKLHRFYMTI